MPSENRQELLEEAVTPHLATDEGQRFLAGQANIDEIHVRLYSSSSSSSATYSCLFIPVIQLTREHFNLFLTTIISPALPWRIHLPPNISRSCS